MATAMLEKHMDENESVQSDFLGSVVAPEPPSDTKIVTQSTVRNALTAAGLDPAEAKDLTPRSAFSRACKELKEERVIRKVDDVKDVIKFQFTQEHLKDGVFEYDYEATLELNKDTGAITCSKLDSSGSPVDFPELALHAQQLLNQAMIDRTTSDVTRLVQRLFSKHANGELYALTRKGGTYFVPEKYNELVDKIDKFYSAMGGELKRFPVPRGNEHGNKAVAGSIASGVMADIETLMKSVDEWDDTTRHSTMEKRAADFKAAQFKLECWRELLSDKADLVSSKLAEAKQLLVNKITQLKSSD